MAVGSYNNFSSETAMATSTASMGFQHSLQGFQHIWTSPWAILNSQVSRLSGVIGDGVATVSAVAISGVFGEGAASSYNELSY